MPKIATVEAETITELPIPLVFTLRIYDVVVRRFFTQADAEDVAVMINRRHQEANGDAPQE